jgi:hypothetical protein
MSTDTKRGTGRTTRMILAAIEHAANRGRAFLLFDNQHQTTREWERTWNNLIDKDTREMDWRSSYADRSIKNSNGGAIFFRIANDLIVWDWEFWRIRGEGPDTFVGVDHYAIENRIRKASEELHRWDS